MTNTLLQSTHYKLKELNAEMQNTGSRLTHRSMVRALIAHNITKKEIANRTGISLGTIYRLLREKETAINHVTFDRLLRLYCRVVVLNNEKR